MDINITVRNKIAILVNPIIAVCGNSDYVVKFDFDSEWDAFENKTARFKYNGEYIDIIFTGNECNMPVIKNAYRVEIGVYAGDLHTTTSAFLIMKKSITSDNGTPAAPAPDAYDQLMQRMNEIEAPEAVLYTEQSLTDEQKAQARENIGAGSDEKPDWEQNDETKKDYIKNRPFWYFTTETHAVNKEEITSTNGTCVNGFRIERDKVYHVTYENQVYKLTSRNFYFSYASMNVYVIGRTPSSMSDFDSDPDDVPFSLFYMDKTNYSGFELVAPPTIDPNIYVEEFEGVEENVKKIPEQCIPYIQSDCNETDTNSPAFIKNFPEIHGCFLGVVEGSTTTENRFPINSKARRIQVYGIDTTGTTTSWHLVGNMSSLSLCSYSPQRGIEINVFEIFYSEADEYWYAKNLTKPGKVEKYNKGRLGGLLFRPDTNGATLEYQLAQWS